MFRGAQCVLHMSKKRIAILFVVLLLAAAGLYYAHRRTLHRGAPTAETYPTAVLNTSPSAAIPETPGHEKPGTGAPPAESAKVHVPAVEAGPILRPGETLEYAANVTKIDSTVATLKILVRDKRDLAGRNVWHLQAFAHTENPYRMIFELDDRFDSYSDPMDLSSHQYEMHLSERGQKVDSVERLYSSPKDFAPAGMIAARVLPETRDPLGFLHYLRNVDWNKTPEVRSPVYDGHKLYDVRAVLKSKSQPASVPAGDFDTTKIEIHVFDNGTEMKDAHFFLYLANDSLRIPVLVEAILPVASARVELTKAK
jgi:Protein of unknown function (DUF3108)